MVWFRWAPLGESPTLSHDEHKRVIELTIRAAKKRIPVVAGAGSNNTLEAIDLSKHAEAAGADGLLHVAGYYNKTLPGRSVSAFQNRTRRL